MEQPRLICFSGLPGVGKTTLSRLVARDTGAVLLRIDSFETAQRQLTGQDLIGPEGYVAAAAAAHDNLNLGRDVLTDAVNDDRYCHAHWEALAARTGARLLAILILCSDVDEHRRRIEARDADLPGQVLPDWSRVQARQFASWPAVSLTIDTAGTTAEASAHRISSWLDAPVA